MTKTLFRVIARDVAGARNLSTPSLGLQEGELYDVVADVQSAKTARVPEGGSSGYLVRHSDTGVVLPQIYKRERFVTEEDQNRFQHEAAMEAGSATAQEDPAPSGDVNPAPGTTGDAISAGDTVVCVDAVGARSASSPETMLEQDEEYRIVADVDDAVTVRNPHGGASGYVVQRTDDDAVLAGVFRRSRFQKVD
jgi:hypothetical protein